MTAESLAAPARDRVSPSSTDADHVRGMARLLRAVQELSLARSIGAIQDVVRTAARELTGCDGATFVLRDGGECYYVDEDAIGPLWKGRRFPLETCISGWVMTHREPAVITDVYADDRIPHAAYRETFVTSLVMVPIRTLDPVGAVGNYWADAHPPTAHEVELLQALADATSIAMENVRIYAELEERVRDRTAELERAYEEIRQVSVTDDLTGLTNRRGFYMLAEPLLHAARRDGRACLLGVIDVDGLKQVNDTHGHVVGDALITDVARVLREALDPSHVLARVGGDEFCVLGTDPDIGPAALRDRILDGLRAVNDTATRPYVLSTSIGLLEVGGRDDGTLDDLLMQADQLMYDEKKTRLEGPWVGRAGLEPAT